jgi:hypothetical protein
MNIIIFSKDRPMQLYACLESLIAQAHGIEKHDVTVVYTWSTDRFQAGYDWIIKYFDDYPAPCYLTFMDEGKTEEGKKYWPFKQCVMEHIGSDKVMFVVDDCIFTHPFSLAECEKELNLNPDAVGVSLRLGHNIDYCYTVNQLQKFPDYILTLQKGSLFKFNWVKGSLEFNNPFEVSSSIYRVREIKPFLENYQWKTPNQLEDVLGMLKKIYFPTKPMLLSYWNSKAFCNPANKVNPSNNRAGVDERYTIENLMTLWEGGYKIDVFRFDGFVNNAVHQEVDYEFIAR